MSTPTILTYSPLVEWPIDTTVFFMKLAAQDAFADLWQHYADLEQWIKLGRIYPKPQLPYYE